MHISTDIEVAYNLAVNSTSLCSPFFMSYVIHPKVFLIETIDSNNPYVSESLKSAREATEFAHNRIVSQNEKMAKYADRSRIPHNFKIGDMVLLSIKNLSLEDGSGMRKLNPKFCGPFKVLEKITEVTVRLELSEPMKARKIYDAFHVSLLKPHYQDQFQRYLELLPPMKLAEGSQEYEVDSIVAKRKKNGKTMYLVRWKG